MSKNSKKKVAQAGKAPTTSVQLSPAAQAIKEALTCEWELRKLLSASLLLFDRQEYLTQKTLILQASGASKSVIEDVEYVVSSTHLLAETDMQKATVFERLCDLYGTDYVQALLDRPQAEDVPLDPADLPVVPSRTTQADAIPLDVAIERVRTARTQYRLLSPEEQKWLDELRAEAIAAQQSILAADQVSDAAVRDTKGGKRTTRRRGSSKPA